MHQRPHKCKDLRAKVYNIPPEKIILKLMLGCLLLGKNK